MAFDPMLEAMWKPKAASSNFPVYRVNAQGRYFVAYPARPMAYQDAGTKLNWGGVIYTKTLGDPGVLPGLWVGDADGDEWNFRADGTVTAASPN